MFNDIHRAVTACRRVFATSILLANFLATAEFASADRKVSPVPPEHEIQVLDPGIDPLGIPAAVLRERAEGLEVDIPPTVLVHKYYYTGDRSFQAQLLPGGPTIVVLSHPKTSERLYIDVQMLPGAPVVTYRGRSVEYDYGDNAITIYFGLWGQIKVRYRNGTSMREDFAEVLQADKLMPYAASLRQRTEEFAATSTTVVVGTVLVVKDTANVLATPVKNLVQMGPFSNLTETLQTRVSEHHNQSRTKVASKSWRKTLY